MDYLEGNPVGETLPADTDTLEHTVALELVKHLQYKILKREIENMETKRQKTILSTTDFMRSAQS